MHLSHRPATSECKAPDNACTSYQTAYQGLAEFEKDLHLHVHLENDILFPGAVELEAATV